MDNALSNMEASEYCLSGGSSMIIREQHFDNVVISQENAEIDSWVEILDSGIIEVREGEIDDDVANEDEGDLYNTNFE
jgi:hypothetical protein